MSPLSIANAPYEQQADRSDGRLDRALTTAWGTLTTYFQPFELRRLSLFARAVDRAGAELKSRTDQRLLESAGDLRSSLWKARWDSEATANAFAMAREAAVRHTGLSHFPVQLLGGAAMMSGALAEMHTGEGKSLTAILPAVTAALMGRPVHVITVNDYLARRDAEQFRATYRALGLEVGLIEQGQPHAERQKAYKCDITYCTNKELVFDYLRDRLVLESRADRARFLVQRLLDGKMSPELLLRGLHFAIIDEADSVLIDEARTPLILSDVEVDARSGAGQYETALDFARRLQPTEHFQVRAGARMLRLTPSGQIELADMARGLKGLWSIRQAREELVRQALVAIHLFHRDVQYLIKDGKVQIIDEFTGRVMPDRSWERGLHQAVEAKEKCEITAPRQTLARITYQRFFRRYIHLCGMTGTATEAAGELRSVYGLAVTRIPTNLPSRRTSLGAQILPSAAEKWEAVVRSARSAATSNRAVLIGTRSVDASEQVSERLRSAGLSPVVLNARQDQLEAEVIAVAGHPGRITVATNMAGRGTDIKLHPAVKLAGGLHVILTEFHESPRIDRQLFGRAGRQGDLGTCESIASVDDELFRRFCSEHLLQAFAWLTSTYGLTRGAHISLLKRIVQRNAERTNARARRTTLAEDEHLGKILGFSGTD